MKKPIYDDLTLIQELAGQKLDVVEEKGKLYINYAFPFDKYSLVKPTTIKKRLSKLVIEALKRLIEKQKVKKKRGR